MNKPLKMSKLYKFNYQIGQPINGGGFKFRSSSKTIMGYDFRGAALKLANEIAKKWTLQPRITILNGVRIEENGEQTFINPDILPEINELLTLKGY